MLRSRERCDASEWRVPGITRVGSLALGRVVAASAAGGLAGRARRVGRATAAAIAAFTALVTHSRCLGHVDCLAQASWNCDQVALVLVLVRPSTLCRLAHEAKWTTAALWTAAANEAVVTVHLLEGRTSIWTGSL